MFTVKSSVKKAAGGVSALAKIWLVLVLITPLYLVAGSQTDGLKMHLAADRLITVGQEQILSLELGGQQVTRLTIKQYDLSWAPLKDLALDGSELARVSGMATNAAGEVLIAGSFSGRLSLGQTVLRASGKDDIFYLVLSADGEALSFKRFGGKGNDHSFAVTLDAYGTFEVQWLLETGADKPNLFMRTKIGEDGQVQDHFRTAFNRNRIAGVDDPLEVVEDPNGVDDPLEVVEDPNGVDDPLEVVEDPNGVDDPLEVVEDPNGVDDPLEVVEDPNGVDDPLEVLEDPNGY